VHAVVVERGRGEKESGSDADDDGEDGDDVGVNVEAPEKASPQEPYGTRPDDIEPFLGVGGFVCFLISSFIF